MITRIFSSVTVLLFFIAGAASAQKCLDAKGQLDFNSLISQYQSDYKLVSIREVRMTSGQILTINSELNADFDYLIGIVCNGSAQAAGVELRDNIGTLMNYNINYNAFKSNEAILEFRDAGRMNYKISVNAIDKNNTEICGKVFIMAKEKIDGKRMKRRMTAF